MNFPLVIGFLVALLLILLNGVYMFVLGAKWQSNRYRGVLAGLREDVDDMQKVCDSVVYAVNCLVAHHPDVRHRLQHGPDHSHGGVE